MLLRVRSAPSRAVETPSTVSAAPTSRWRSARLLRLHPHARHGCDRPLWPRARRRPGGGDRVGRRERRLGASPRESLGRIGEGPRSDHVEILSPCVRCMDKRASRGHNPLEVRTGRIGAGTGIIIGRNRERNRERVRFRHNCPNPPFGRETHVDGAWLDPDAFGRAARDLFPRNRYARVENQLACAESPPWAESG